VQKLLFLPHPCLLGASVYTAHDGQAVIGVQVLDILLPATCNYRHSTGFVNSCSYDHTMYSLSFNQQHVN